MPRKKKRDDNNYKSIIIRPTMSTSKELACDSVKNTLIYEINISQSKLNLTFNKFVAIFKNIKIRNPAFQIPESSSSNSSSNNSGSKQKHTVAEESGRIS